MPNKVTRLYCGGAPRCGDCWGCAAHSLAEKEKQEKAAAEKREAEVHAYLLGYIWAGNTEGL